MKWFLRILETPEELTAVEDLQREVWPGSETDVVPTHLLLAGVHNGGVAIGAFEGASQAEVSAALHKGQAHLVGFVFGFPGLYFTPDGPRPKHNSHMLGVLSNYRNEGIGFALKRAQWQMVRHQGIDLITWTFDPLLSLNAQLNIAKLGAVCNTYMRNFYGMMRDGLNAGLPSDRFQVDWWVNSKRVNRRLSRHARKPLKLEYFLAAGAEIINPAHFDEDGWPHPPTHPLDKEQLKAWRQEATQEAGPRTNPALEIIETVGRKDALLLVEIPADFQALKAAAPAVARDWRLHTRMFFETLFAAGYLITDFIYQPGQPARSFYVLSHGESTL